MHGQIFVMPRLFTNLARCPKCGSPVFRGLSKTPTIKKTRQPGRNKKVTLPIIKGKQLTEKIAEIVHKNSENKGGILIENYARDLSLSEAFIRAGFSRVIATTPDESSIIKEGEVAEIEVQKAKNIFSQNVIWSKEEDLMSERLPHRLWADEPVLTVFSIVSSEGKLADQNLSNYLIRKLCHLSGFYGRGRVEWFLFVSPSVARRLLCGNGEGPKMYYHAKSAVVNALYDVKHCLTVSTSDFVPKFKTGQFTYKVPTYIEEEPITADKVYLLKLVPRRDLHIAIPTQDIWPFYLFLKQLLYKHNARIIPIMETFIHGCGLKMIDMGFTMAQETWQVKSAQYLDLYRNAISWPEFQDSFMQSYLTGKLKDEDNSAEDHEKDTSELSVSDITSSDIELDHIVSDVTPLDIELDKNVSEVS